ncbi:MAG: dihydrofolate reductase [Gammaproteobacteria bacterium]|nr:dihydrofolate reductase [Gammaproteobacteria bacterium]
MIIHAIVAMSENRVIGINNQLPWHLPADLAHFKALTLGKPIIMGRKTFQSIGRPLPGRRNIILSHDKNFSAEGCIVTHSIEEALNQTQNDAEIFVIGGAHLFADMLPRIDVIDLTIIHHTFEGDAFFPEIDPTIWHETNRIDHSIDDKNPHAFSFLTLERRE